jgi:hypothetical protein
MTLSDDGRVLVVLGFPEFHAIFKDPWNVLDVKAEESATPALLKSECRLGHDSFDQQYGVTEKWYERWHRKPVCRYDRELGHGPY